MNSNDFNNTQKNNLINNNEDKNNDLLKSQEFNFNFIGTKFLWKELMKLNTKYIERSGDISLITPYVQNILCSRLTQDNIDMLSEEYIIQLVTLLQLTGQYLVYTQKMLEEENERLTDENSYLKNNVTENEKYSKIIDDLNRQNQEKDFLIKTYQDMIQTRNGISDKDLDDNINNKNLKSNKKKYYYCSFCSGKKFISQKYLDEHIERRHYNQKDLIKSSSQKEEEKSQEKKNYRQVFEDKLNLIVKDFELKMKQQEENNDFALLNEKIESLKQKMLEQNLNNNEFINENNINYQNNINYPQKIEKNEIKESATNKEYKKKYEEMKKRYDELKKKAENDYKDILIKYNEQEKKLEELQNLSNNIEKDKTNRIQNEPIKNTSITRSQNKFYTNDMIRMKTYENDNKIINDIDNKNNIDKDSNKQDNKINQNMKKGKSINNNYNEEDNQNGEKIFDNTPLGDESLIKNQKDNNKKIENKNSNKNIEFENSEIIQSKNMFISKNFEQEKNERLKAFDNNDPINQTVVNSIIMNNMNNNKKNDVPTLTISKFRKAFEERDENYKGSQDDYNKIPIPEKYNYSIEQKIEEKKEEIKEKLNNSINSKNVKKLMEDKNNRDSIYKKYYEKLNEAFNLQELFNSYNKYQQEKNKNQMIQLPFSKASSLNNNEKNKPEGTHILRASNNPISSSENPYSLRPSKVSRPKELA